MSAPRFTDTDILAFLAEEIRQTDARLFHALDRDMIAQHKERRAMLRAIERRIAPDTYLQDEGGEP